MKRRQWIQAAASSALLGAAHTGFAQNKYPSKPISWVVGYAAGGNADLRSRAMARAMGEILKGTIIVENRPGAGANIGTSVIAKAAPDGYTIGMGSFAPLSVNAALFKSMPFAPSDITPIMLIEKGPLMLMVNANSPYQTLKELIAAIKAKPGQLAYSTGGIGGSHHLSAALFCNAVGLDMIPVHFKSGSEGATALLGNQVTMMFVQMYEAMPMVEAGKLRALAITSAKRSPLQPKIVTMIESGYPDVEVLNWQGLIGPKGMSAELVQQLNAAANKALLSPDVKDKLLAQGNVLGGGTPEQFAALIKSETAKWSKVVKDAKIEAQ